MRFPFRRDSPQRELSRIRSHIAELRKEIEGLEKLGETAEAATDADAAEAYRSVQRLREVMAQAELSAKQAELAGLLEREEELQAGLARSRPTRAPPAGPPPVEELRPPAGEELGPEAVPSAPAVTEAEGEELGVELEPASPTITEPAAEVVPATEAPAGEVVEREPVAALEAPAAEAVEKTEALGPEPALETPPTGAGAQWEEFVRRYEPTAPTEIQPARARRLWLPPKVAVALAAVGVIAVGAGAFSLSGLMQSRPGPVTIELAPGMNELVTERGQTFFTREIQFAYSGGQVVLSGPPPDGMFSVDDGMTMKVTRPDGSTATWTRTFNVECEEITPISEEDVTNLFQAGVNVVSVSLYDVCGGGMGTAGSIFLSSRP